MHRATRIMPLYYAYGSVRGMEQKFEASLLTICCFLMLMTPAAMDFLTKMSALFKPIAFAGLISYSLYIWHFLQVTGFDVIFILADLRK